MQAHFHEKVNSKKTFSKFLKFEKQRDITLHVLLGLYFKENMKNFVWFQINLNGLVF